MQMRLLSLLGAASLMLSFMSAVVAQDRNYPQKQITLIVPFSAGGSTDVVAQELADEVAARIAVAGLEVLEARISSLAYAPEIAQAMLQRQQASAVIAAREKIVEGAVSMVQNALTKLEEEDIVALDDERRAAMVSNLLVILCSESRATPVVNAGSLYT